MTMAMNDYRLLDFGDGRKLECVGGVILDRPSPAAAGESRADATKWREAHLKLDDLTSKQWRFLRDLPSLWTISLGNVQLLLRPTPFGHIGVFPEQQKNWEWFQSLSTTPGEVKRCLNLFAYTGASSLVLANAGWHVTHVDASRPTILWGRENAILSGLADAPIRWIQEDASRFLQREIRRGNRYDLVLLDPPAYGHGPKGERWSIEEGMVDLLSNVFEVLVDRAVGVLWTGHSDAELVRPLVQQCESLAQKAGLKAERLQRATLDDTAGRHLDFGYRVRWLPKA
jgi:23S rRNA (cytosine1962-C5)-methyltransferase